MSCSPSNGIFRMIVLQVSAQKVESFKYRITALVKFHI